MDVGSWCGGSVGLKLCGGGKCKCEMECIGEISSSGEAKTRKKDYSVGDGGQGVEGKGVKYVGDGAVMYRIIFSRC